MQLAAGQHAFRSAQLRFATRLCAETKVARERIVSSRGEPAVWNASSRAAGLPQSGRSCSEVEGELYVAWGEIERDKVTGGVTVMAIVHDHAVRRGWF